MSSGKNHPRLLGVAFLTVLLLTFSEFWALSIIGTGSLSDSLISISNNLIPLRLSILLGLILSVGIIVLAVLLFTVLQKQNKTMALVALSCYLLESVTLVLRQLSVYALIPLSLEYTKAGALSLSHLETLGAVFLDIGRWVYDVHLLFFALGGILWYILLYRTKYIPRLLAFWGIVAAALVLIASVLAGFEIRAIVLVLPNALFELAIGLWIVAKGIKSYE